MSKLTSDASWVAITGAAVLAVAAQQDWTSLHGALIGGGLCLAALGAALKSPPAPMPPAAEPTKDEPKRTASVADPAG